MIFPLLIYTLASFSTTLSHITAWDVLGYAGILMFGSRWIVQWIQSEMHGESHIDAAFWWQSLAANFMCLAYFLHLQNGVGILGYAINFVPYSRNLVLIYRKRRRDLAAAAASGENQSPAN